MAQNNITIAFTVIKKFYLGQSHRPMIIQYIFIYAVITCIMTEPPIPGPIPVHVAIHH